MKSTTALLALAAAVHASPMSKRVDPAAWDNKDTLCKGWDLRTPEGVDKLWEESGAGGQLDMFILMQWEHENNWLKNVEDQVSGGTDGKGGAGGCGVLSGDCNPLNGISCTEQYDKFGQDTIIGKNSYWIFQAAKGVHAKFNELKRQLTDETLINGLRIGQMVSDFDGSEDDPSNVLGWLAAASTMGNAVGGLVPGAGNGFAAGFGILGGIFSGLAANSEEEIDQGTISAALADVFEAATKKIEDTLRIVMGGGNEDEYNSLPAPKWDTFQSKITKFFNGGWFLLDDDAEAVRVAISSISNNIKTKVANDVMKAAKLHLVADKRDGFGSREDCGYAPGRQWMKLKDDEEYCFYIMRNKPNNNRIKDWVEVDADIYDKMAGYGLGDREKYYQAVLDCALSDADDIDVGNMAWGQIPQCYYNLPAVFIEKDNDVGCGDPFSDPDCAYVKATPIE
ncbi:hypothetical protein FSARC_13537 [Fusarium sarcochroum]|uniref:Uncharacterized protein n=1 Tax=Fusarium sarcochroum TaxID=1208366 RepID=A0A8H4WTB0_9HYPO|nr:hypothetical protein FSARC_13537 [Fusarium sarcochroum]